MNAQRNIILTGFMACGKTTVGRILAKRTGRHFADTDEWIEQQTGKSIPEIFEDDGEAIFRRWEEQAAVHFAGIANHVIATGGKLMLDPANALDLQRNGDMIRLAASPPTILARLTQSGSDRPLLQNSDPTGRVRHLLAIREPQYAKFPTVHTDAKTPEMTANEIIDGLASGELKSEMLFDTAQRPPASHTFTIKHPTGSYPIIVGENIVSNIRDLAGISHTLVLVTDSNVGPLYAGKIKADLTITVPAGEAHKNLGTVRHIYDEMLNAGIDRSGTIVALGGGVVGDMAGFVAASYMRGIKFVQAPTTLLAMVDASVGGKTGVDMPQGKNLIGAFKQPQAVIMDTTVWQTLPKEEWNAGMAEVIKHGLIASPALLQQISNLQSPISNLHSLLIRAIQVKQRIVQKDPYEQGRRMVLNLGHTFGHAIEQVSHYAIRHGEGVAMGLLCAAKLSAKLGHCAPSLAAEIEAILQPVGLPTEVPAFLDRQQLLLAMNSDKKKHAGKLHFILLRDSGDVFISDQVEEAEVLAALSN